MGLFSGVSNLFKYQIGMVQGKFQELHEARRERYKEEFSPNPQFPNLDNMNDQSLRKISEISIAYCDKRVQNGKKLSEAEKDKLKEKFAENEKKAKAQMKKFSKPFKGRNNFHLQEYRCKLIGSYYAVSQYLKKNNDALREAWGIEEQEIPNNIEFKVEPDLLLKELQAASNLAPAEFKLEKYREQNGQELTALKEAAENLKNALHSYHPIQKDHNELLKNQLERKDIMLCETELDYVWDNYQKKADTVYNTVKDNLEEVLYYRMLKCKSLKEANDVYEQHDIMLNVLQETYELSCNKLEAQRKDSDTGAQPGVVAIESYYGEKKHGLLLKQCTMMPYDKLAKSSKEMSNVVIDLANTCNSFAASAVKLVQNKELRAKGTGEPFETVFRKSVAEHREALQAEEQQPFAESGKTEEKQSLAEIARAAQALPPKACSAETGASGRAGQEALSEKNQPEREC